MSTRSLWLALLAGLVAAPAAGWAENKPAGHTASRSVAKKSSKLSKRNKATAKSRRKRQRRAKANLPPGWTWPPTKQMRAQGEVCKKQLTAMGVRWQPGKREGRIVTPVQVTSLNFGGFQFESRFRKPPFNIDCHLVWAFAEAAPQLLALGAQSAVFSSFFRNTKVRVHGTTKNAMSRHSFGLATDLYSIADAQGNIAVVEADYPAGNTVLYDFEDAINATGLFRTVLTPANDPISHDDHFHIEANVGALHHRRAAAKSRGSVASVKAEPGSVSLREGTPEVTPPAATATGSAPQPTTVR